MPTVALTNKQVLDLVEQLPADQQLLLFQRLAARHWPSWSELSRVAGEHARSVAAARSRDWQAMREDERDRFVDDLVHEDRQWRGSRCSTRTS